MVINRQPSHNFPSTIILIMKLQLFKEGRVMHKLAIWFSTIVLGFGISAQSGPVPRQFTSSAVTQLSAPHNTTSELNRNIDLWIQHLGQENSFKNWTGAHWTSYPLGPGTHGWVVIIEQGKQQVGYLIVG